MQRQISLKRKVTEERDTTAKFKLCRKLLLNQYDKEVYKCHYSILKFYLSKGMILKRVHRAIRFRQKRFLEPYIQYNSRRRAQSKNAFENDFYKLKNNSLYGKTMEDVRKRIDYRRTTEVAQNETLTASPFFHNRHIISEDVFGVQLLKNKVVLCKPVYVGQAVLDYSKLEMYKLFYDNLKNFSKLKRVKLLGGDTYRFFLALTTDSSI